MNGVNTGENMQDFPHHGNPPKPIPPPKESIGDILIYFSLFILLSILIFTPFFAVIDFHIEGTVTFVNGTFEDECNYWGGGHLQNSSNPLNWIQIDGERYIAREVDFDRFGDVGNSLIGKFQPGDNVQMRLFPYKTYNFWNDSPAMWATLYCLPMGIALWSIIIFRIRGGLTK